jgi:hypothetical protein
MRCIMPTLTQCLMADAYDDIAVYPLGATAVALVPAITMT